LLSGQEAVVRGRGFRMLTVLASLLAACVLLLNPARPLLPVQTIVQMAKNRGLSPGLVARAERVYSVYRDRANSFEPAIKLLPPGTKLVGMVTFDDPETAMWRPFGSRKVVHLCTTDGPEDAKARGVEYAWVSARAFAMFWREPFDAWLARMHGQVVNEIKLGLRAGEPDQTWQLVKLQ